MRAASAHLLHIPATSIHTPFLSTTRLLSPLCNTQVPALNKLGACFPPGTEHPAQDSSSHSAEDFHTHTPLRCCRAASRLLCLPCHLPVRPGMLLIASPSSSEPLFGFSFTLPLLLPRCQPALARQASDRLPASAACLSPLPAHTSATCLRSGCHLPQDTLPYQHPAPPGTRHPPPPPHPYLPIIADVHTGACTHYLATDHPSVDRLLVLTYAPTYCWLRHPRWRGWLLAGVMLARVCAVGAPAERAAVACWALVCCGLSARRVCARDVVAGAAAALFGIGKQRAGAISLRVRATRRAGNCNATHAARAVATWQRALRAAGDALLKALART